MKVLISLDAGLLRRIDRKARSRGISRSAYLAGLAERDAQSRPESVKATLMRLDKLFERAPAGDSTADIRAERDAR